MEQQPNREVSWYFSLDESVAGGELESQKDCLVAYAEARGAVVTYRGSSVAQLDFDGTYAQLSPLLDLALVAEWGVSCNEVDCEYCKSLSLEACQQDAFCRTVLAGRLDPTLGCVWRDEPAGCHIEASMCELVVTHALSQSADCWEFSDDCLPDGFVDHTLQTPAQGVDCSEVFADEPPACE